MNIKHKSKDRYIFALKNEGLQEKPKTLLREQTVEE